MYKSFEKTHYCCLRATNVLQWHAAHAYAYAGGHGLLLMHMQIRKDTCQYLLFTHMQITIIRIQVPWVALHEYANEKGHGLTWLLRHAYVIVEIRMPWPALHAHANLEFLYAHLTRDVIFRVPGCTRDRWHHLESSSIDSWQVTSSSEFLYAHLTGGDTSGCVYRVASDVRAYTSLTDCCYGYWPLGCHHLRHCALYTGEKEVKVIFTMETGSGFRILLCTTNLNHGRRMSFHFQLNWAPCLHINRGFVSFRRKSITRPTRHHKKGTRHLDRQAVTSYSTLRGNRYYSGRVYMYVAGHLDRNGGYDRLAGCGISSSSSSVWFHLGGGRIDSRRLCCHCFRCFWTAETGSKIYSSMGTI